VTHVRLVCHPDGDELFAAQAALSMRIELPLGKSSDAMLPDIVAELRKSYPLVAIRTEPPIDGGPATWHVFRDGLPGA
jgi:hypothetical protein